MGGFYPTQPRSPTVANPVGTRYVPSSTRRALPRTTFKVPGSFDPWDTPAAKRAYKKFGGIVPKSSAIFGRKP